MPSPTSCPKEGLRVDGQSVRVQTQHFSVTLDGGLGSADLPWRRLKLPLWEEAQFHALGLALECSGRLVVTVLPGKKPQLE